MEPLAAKSGGVLLQSLEFGMVPRPELRQKDVIDEPARLNQLHQRFAIASTQPADIHFERRGRKARNHLFEVCRVGQLRSIITAILPL